MVSRRWKGQKNILTEAISLSDFGPAKVLLQLWLLGSTRPCTLSPLLPVATFHNHVLRKQSSWTNIIRRRVLYTQTLHLHHE
jgi:hypothetical protein